MNIDYDPGEFFRFLESQARLRDRDEHPLTPPEGREHQRLPGETGGAPIGSETGCPIGTSLPPTAVAILEHNCKSIAGEEPLICPRSAPRLPLHLLPRVEHLCREAGQIGPGGTVLWVGQESEIDTYCAWEQNCRCFGPAERVDRLGGAVSALLLDIDRVLQAGAKSEAFVRGLANARARLGVLGPLGVFYKSAAPPDFPPRDLALAFFGLSRVVNDLGDCVFSVGSTEPDPARVAELLDQLERTGETFRAMASRVWPGLPPEPLGPLRLPEGGATPKRSGATEAFVDGGLRFEPGAFLYRNHRQDLRGMPLKVLEALAKAIGNVLTLAELLEQCWGETVVGEEAVRSAVKTARAALRRAICESRVDCPDGLDPIPIVDRGSGRTAWRLDLP